MTQGAKFTKWRESERLTHVDVFKKLGVSSPSVISRIERDKYIPGLHLALDIDVLTVGSTHHVRAVDWPRKKRKNETEEKKPARVRSRAA